MDRASLRNGAFNGFDDIPAGVKSATGIKMVQEYYRQMRKVGGCNILAVVQQYDIIKDSAVRGAMIGNSNILLKLNTRITRGRWLQN